MPMDKRFEELPRELCHESERLEWELPDPDRRILYDPRWLFDPFLELEGRRGEWLLGRESLEGDFGSSLSVLITDGRLAFGSVVSSLLRDPTGKSVVDFLASGDPGAEVDLCNSACGMVGLLRGLADPVQGVVGDACVLEVLRRRLSMSSRTISIRISAGSSRLARLSVSERN